MKDPILRLTMVTGISWCSPTRHIIFAPKFVSEKLRSTMVRWLECCSLDLSSCWTNVHKQGYELNKCLLQMPSRNWKIANNNNNNNNNKKSAGSAAVSDVEDHLTLSPDQPSKEEEPVVCNTFRLKSDFFPLILLMERNPAPPGMVKTL